MTEELDLQKLPGLIANVCLTGLVTQEFGANLRELRSWNDRNGFHKVEYVDFDAKLVEAGRDAAVSHALANGYAWLLQIDADAAPFPPNSLAVLLQDAFVDYPDADAVGAYCQLKGDIPLPTIDTGTGTWEEWYPDSGVLPVIRTGAHFLFTKVSAFQKMGDPPWFKTRSTPPTIQAFGEIDNFSRTELDGQNPLRGPVWDGLVQSAIQKSLSETGHVGEDSGWLSRHRGWQSVRGRGRSRRSHRRTPCGL